jgi:hypothetical protein
MKIRHLVWSFPVLLALSPVGLRAQENPPAPPPAQPAPSEAAPATPNQPAYQPKFAGDPARSDAEAGALGYMRVVARAQKEYYKKHNQYAETLPALVNSGSFTRRMASTTDRGEYHVGFKGRKDGYILILTPKNMDPQHRSFYADENGVMHADEEKPAGPESPKVK